MKNMLLLAAAALGIGACAAAAGQAPAAGGGAQVQLREEAAPSINLTMEQRHIIKEIILKDLKVPKTTADAPVEVGAAVPDAVSLQPFPAEVAQKVPQVKAHAFFVKDDLVIVVDPKNKQVSDVIK